MTGNQKYLFLMTEFVGKFDFETCPDTVKLYSLCLGLTVDMVLLLSLGGRVPRSRKERASCDTQASVKSAGHILAILLPRRSHITKTKVCGEGDFSGGTVCDFRIHCSLLPLNTIV